MTRSKTSGELVVLAAKAFVATMLITEAVYQMAGPPIEGVNLIGRFIGVQMVPNGIWANLPKFTDFSRFFHQMII